MRARRVDANQAALRTLWLSVGGSWLTIAPEHGGEPDALIGWRGEDRLVEVKRPDVNPARRRPRPNQAEWHLAWRPIELHGIDYEPIAAASTEPCS